MPESVHGSESPETARHVFTIHGMRTYGKWQKDLVPAFNDAVDPKDILKPRSLDYGWSPAVFFLFKATRNAGVEAFRKMYDEACLASGCPRPSLVAHSLGSYRALYAMQKYKHIVFDQVILVGSILPREFPLDSYIKAGRIRRVLHQYGRQDFWSKVAELTVPNAGSSGAYGFFRNHPKLLQQGNREFQHSDYFFERNYKDNWVQFLTGGDVEESTIEGFHSSPRNHLVSWLIIFLLGALLGAGLTKWLIQAGPASLAERITNGGEFTITFDPKSTGDLAMGNVLAELETSGWGRLDGREGRPYASLHYGTAVRGYYIPSTKAWVSTGDLLSPFPPKFPRTLYYTSFRCGGSMKGEEQCQTAVSPQKKELLVFGVRMTFDNDGKVFWETDDRKTIRVGYLSLYDGSLHP